MSMNNNNGTPNTAVLITIIAAAVAFVALVTILIAMGKDPSDLLTLIAVIVPVVIIQVLNNSKLERNSEKLTEVITATNGHLTKQFTDQTAAINAHTSSVVGTEGTEDV